MQQWKETQSFRKKRERAQLRRDIVAELKKKEYTYREIRNEVMKRLNLRSYSLQTLHNDIQEIIQEWRDERLNNTDDYVQLTLQRNNTVRREAWEMWEKSKQDYTKEKAKQTNVPIPDGEQGESTNLATIKLEAYREEINAGGDPRYLDIILKANQEEAKLLGLYAPEKHDHSGEISFTNMLMATSVD